MKKLLSLLLLCCLVFLLASCGYKDIDKRFFVVSIGLDKAQTNETYIRVLLKLAVPSSDPRAGKSTYVIVQEEGDSIAEAIRMIKSKVDKELDFSHAKMIVFGEAVASSGIREWIDWFVRRRDIQMIAWVGVGKPNAAAILSTSPVSERLPSNTLFNTFGETGTESSYVVSEYLFDFRKRLYERGLDPILPLIEVSRNEKLFQINQASVFDKNKQRLVLGPQETRLFNILTNRTKRAEIHVASSKQKFYVDVDKSKTSYRFVESAGAAPKIIAEMKLEGSIEEAQTPISSDLISLYKQTTEASFKKEALRLLKLLQKEKLDPIGLGLLYRSRSFDRKDWENWQSLYASAEFEVQVQFTLQGTGGLG
ncbi:spore germination protein KC [Paenibacillus sp. UNCCL117]|uniref:Ger(x)C family spore germination protein n=1 Tax=unclassified Paenibacillus TaxID=185978 RepID=UPI000880D77B|nr:MULTISPECIES: Ger(x)C family spore germination protein [unclassified Paenibacillus]SDC85478.1 spore germination protein KC [Paenibacillus sp. cl123]SFW27557.1 spore germination protein KC [Paenibacillus sp. UNCCL117]